MRFKKLGLFAIAIALFFAGVIPASASVPPSWSSPVILSGPSFQPESPRIVASQNGNLTAIWRQFDGDSSAVIQTSRSADGGATWNDPAILSDTGQNAVNPNIVARPDSTLVAIWEQLNNLNKFVVKSSVSSNGVSWSAPVDLAILGGEASSPQLVARSDDSVVAAWQGVGPDQNIIESRRSSDGGASWQAAVTLSNGAGSAQRPQLAVASNGTLFAVWDRDNGSNTIVQFASSTDGGLNWSEPRDLSGVVLSASAQLAIAPGGGGGVGVVVVVWVRCAGGNCLVQSSNSADGGVSWGVPLNISPAGQVAGYPHILAAPDNTFVAAWEHFNGSHAVIQSNRSSNGGASWAIPVDLSSEVSTAFNVQLAAAPNGTLSAAWALNDGSQSVVQSADSTDGGVSWNEPTQLDGAVSSTAAPQLAVASSGSVVAVWDGFDSGGGGGGVYFVRSAFTLVSETVPAVPPSPPAVNAPSGSLSPPKSGGPRAYGLPTPGPTGPAETTPAPDASPAPVSKPAALDLLFGFTVGDSVAHGSVKVRGDDFRPASAVTVTLHSTPLLLGTVKTSATGSFDQTLFLPATVDPGIHHIEVAYVGSDEAAVSQSWYFQVNDSGVVTKQQSEPTGVPPSWATSTARAETGPGQLTVGGVTYLRYLPSLHPAETVETVISSLVLLTLLGGVGAVAAFGAGGSMALAGAGVVIGSERGAPLRSNASAPKSASLASAKVKHLKFQQEATARGDRSSTWLWVGHGRLDVLSLTMPARLNRFSPLLARVANDGAYLRAMFGPLWLVTSVVGITLGVLATASTGGAAVPPVLGLMIAVVVLSAFDVLGGLLAASTFTIGVALLGGLGTLAAARTMLGIDVIFFTVALTASAARPLRRLPAKTATDWFDRSADVVIAALISTWAITKMIGALPALSGLVLPIADSAISVALCAGAAIVARYVLETTAAYLYPLRLAAVAPPKIGFPSPYQQVTSALLKTGLFVFVAIAYLGNLWPLWVGAALFLIPSIIAAFQTKLPNVPRLVKLIPGGVVKIVLMLCIGRLLGGWLGSTVHNPQELIGLAFVILSIPSLILGFAGFFGRDGERWALNWPVRIGGVLLVGFGVLLVLGIVRIP